MITATQAQELVKKTLQEEDQIARLKAEQICSKIEKEAKMGKRTLRLFDENLHEVTISILKENGFNVKSVQTGINESGYDITW